MQLTAVKYSSRDVEAPQEGNSLFSSVGTTMSHTFSSLAAVSFRCLPQAGEQGKCMMTKKPQEGVTGCRQEGIAVRADTMPSGRVSGRMPDVPEDG